MGVTAAGRCETHELPLDARGECQLCRLGAIPSKPPPTRTTSWIVAGVAVAIVAGGLLVFRATSVSEREPPPRGVPVTATPSEPAPTRAPTPPPPRPSARPDRPASVPLPPRPTDPAGTWRVQTAPEPPAPSRPSAEAEPTEDDARRALADVQIEMYAASWCPSCRRAREYLDYNGIAYTEYDIDEDAGAKARLADINPRTSIPTFEIDEIVQVGFSPESFQHQLNEAVRRRLQ